MKSLLIGLLALMTLSSSAYALSTFNNRGTQYVTGSFGFTAAGASSVTDEDTIPNLGQSGFFAFGGGFDYMYEEGLSLGAFFRYHSTEDDYKALGQNTTDELSMSAINIGANAKFYVPYNSWGLYFAPGFGFLDIEYEFGNASESSGFTFAPSFAIGVLVAVNDKIDLGVENQRVWGLGEAANGIMLSDWVFTLRYRL